MSLLRKAGKLLRLLASRSGRRGLRHGVAMTVEHQAALAGLQVASVVDIGANKGQFSLFAEAVFPGARIITFEPLSAPAARFRRLFAADQRVRLVESAVGPRSEHVTMHLSAREDSSSLLPVGAAQAELFPGTAECGTTTVEVAPLARFIGADDIAAPALLKIDVQGYELEALRGCGALLARFDWVYVECSFVELYDGQALAPQVVAFLEDAGFAEQGRFNQVDDPARGAVQADLLFRRRRDRAGA